MKIEELSTRWEIKITKTRGGFFAIPQVPDHVALTFCHFSLSEPRGPWSSLSWPSTVMLTIDAVENESSRALIKLPRKQRAIYLSCHHLPTFNSQPTLRVASLPKISTLPWDYIYPISSSVSLHSQNPLFHHYRSSDQSWPPFFLHTLFFNLFC